MIKLRIKGKKALGDNLKSLRWTSWFCEIKQSRVHIQVDQAKHSWHWILNQFSLFRYTECEQWLSHVHRAKAWLSQSQLAHWILVVWYLSSFVALFICVVYVVSIDIQKTRSFGGLLSHECDDLATKNLGSLDCLMKILLGRIPIINDTELTKEPHFPPNRFDFVLAFASDSLARWFSYPPQIQA